ncbi:fatty acid hydroxylase domain-containing protein 2 [Trichonephila inaurata madagascariensis]|uniref:Fatty acid hydroxylase domain-containing protein 2 n=1 Tax=Trichonephila inaurata madagascariensis TaxID=2747483 RepID=A0A8X6YRZ2_9ARAC|nr:fatty acid hydroxylase domain-containing protein 2 [Trichonephila inaurata madagascariensis]
MLNFQYYWEECGSFLQDQWNSVCELFGSDFALAVWGSFIVTTLFYWTVGSCYTFFHLTGKPKFMQKYSIHDTNTVPFSQVWKVIPQMIMNQLLIIPSGIIFYYLMVWRGYDSGKTLPSFQRVFFELVIHTFVNEIVFYYTHRILHRPTLYKYIHKRHHEWTVPIAISAIYSHPIEHILSNVLIFVPSFLILGSHMSVVWLWTCMAISFTLNTHSGINFPFTPLSPEFHDYHHIK